MWANQRAPRTWEMPATGSAKVSHHGTDWEHGLSTPRAQARHLKSWPCKHSDRHTPSRLPGHRDSGRGGPRPGCVALLKPRAWAAWPQPVLRPWWSQIHPGHSRGWRGDTNAIMVPQHSRLSWEPDLCRLWPWVRHSPSLSSGIITYFGGLITKSCPTLATPWTIACQAILLYNTVLVLPYIDMNPPPLDFFLPSTGPAILWIVHIHQHQNTKDRLNHSSPNFIQYSHPIKPLLFITLSDFAFLIETWLMH